MKADNLYVCVTCDTELHPPWSEGSWKKMAGWSFEQGVPFIRETLNRNNIKGTFFVQGTAAEQFLEIVRSLAEDGHLIGSHGYNHENYGGKPVKVWTKSHPVFLENIHEKKKLLVKANKIIESITGCVPEVFVAPFDNINDELLSLVDDIGFKVDCSFNNYALNMNSFPFHPIEGRRLVEIPLTVLFNKFCGYKNILEAFTYDRQDAEIKLNEYLNDSKRNCLFTVVLITCHPYEFIDFSVPHPPERLIVGKRKRQALQSVIDIFNEFKAEFVTPLQVAHIFQYQNVENNKDA